MYHRPQRLDLESPSGSATSTASAAIPSVSAKDDPLASTDYWDWCPRCSNRLESMKCKYICKRCGYYMSCADFD